jgi:hypothetical protein
LGIVDSGIDTSNPEFSGRISPASADVAGQRSVVNGDSDHGTQVALTAAAARNNSGIMGIAWGATILALRADTPGSCATVDPTKPDSSGCSFDDTAIAAGVDRAVSNGAKVINISLGGSAPAPLLVNAIGRATAAGVVIVVSAGNDGASAPDAFASGLQQAGNGNVIIAGSVNDTGLISAFSNHAGAEANAYLAALGEDVCCVYANGQIKVTTDSTGQSFVTVVSGTSFSAPQISGAVALLLQYFPNLTAAQVVNLLLSTARDAGAAGTDPVYGRGILDIGNAFAPQGATALAGSTTQLPLGATTIVTSSAMGGAAQGAQLNAIVLDSYQRAYQVNLAQSAKSAQVSPHLASALLGTGRNLSAGGGPTSLAFSVTDPAHSGGGGAWAGQLRLSQEDAEAVRVLAARVVTRIAPGTSLGFAYAQGADGLVAQLQGQNRPAFLVTSDPLDDFGFGRSQLTAVAVRRSLGKWGLTLGADGGKVLSGAPLQYSEGFGQVRHDNNVTRFALALDRGFGPVEAGFGANWLAEQHTILGAQLNNAFGAGGADSVFLDLAGAWHPAAAWRLGAAYRRGFTHAHGGGFIGAGSDFSSSGWALDVSRLGLFQTDDSLGLRIAQPLRVERGGLNFLLPVAYSYDTLAATDGVSRLNLSPNGREVSTELAWHGALWGGAASTSLFWRIDPGHYASLPDDKGVAFSWNSSF